MLKRFRSILLVALVAVLLCPMGGQAKSTIPEGFFDGLTDEKWQILHKEGETTIWFDPNTFNSYYDEKTPNIYNAVVWFAMKLPPHSEDETMRELEKEMIAIRKAEIQFDRYSKTWKDRTVFLQLFYKNGLFSTDETIEKWKTVTPLTLAEKLYTKIALWDNERNKNSK